MTNANIKCSGQDCNASVDAPQGNHPRVVSYTCSDCTDGRTYSVYGVALLLNGLEHDTCSIHRLESGRIRFIGIEPEVYLDSRQSVALRIPSPRTDSPEHQQLVLDLLNVGWTLTLDSVN